MKSTRLETLEQLILQAAREFKKIDADSYAFREILFSKQEIVTCLLMSYTSDLKDLLREALCILVENEINATKWKETKE